MFAWLTDTLGDRNALYVAYGAGAIGVLLLVWVLWFWTRRVSGGVFVHGGRGRQPRLAVVDAAAIDSHRRIVLVRRDDVEHLVMIGGHNDLVIESGISGPEAASRENEGGQPAAAPVRPAAAAPGEKRVRATPARGRRESPKPAAVETPRPAARPVPAPVRKPETKPAPEQAQRPAPTPEPGSEPASPERPIVAVTAASQGELPHAYAEFQDESPAANSPDPEQVQPSPERAGIAPAPRTEELGFNIRPETAVAARKDGDAAQAFEEHVQASIAETEQSASESQSADDGTLEDEMQKLLAELTRKK
ncbi:flagellar biosynthetic protein FliO [Oricola thermophila]|uniref:Flagellar biosynthetic protein FliO n=1 Tax=Oricola thermophila TaxID=2742145 RepID=A0A6N1V9P3_9HYPH|nr:flagellar biosynthetic protein FliO [Oricola thermophila]QKV17684.1 flagellar biosynthetic protein FliO [Oricola thermophila]